MNWRENLLNLFVKISRIECDSWSTTSIDLIAVLTSWAFCVKCCSSMLCVDFPFVVQASRTGWRWSRALWIRSKFSDFHIENRVRRMWFPSQEIEMLATVTKFVWYYWCASVWLMRTTTFPKCHCMLPMPWQSHKIARCHLVTASIGTRPTADMLGRKTLPLQPKQLIEQRKRNKKNTIYKKSFFPKLFAKCKNERRTNEWTKRTLCYMQFITC